MFDREKSCPEVFYKKRWHDACNFYKKETLGQVFSCEFCEIFKITFFTEHFRTTTASGQSPKHASGEYSKSVNITPYMI